MAILNPALEDGFDLDSNNLIALGTLVDDGYATNEIPKSGNINTIFKELYRYMQFLKQTGVSQYDSTVSYPKFARIMRGELVYSSLSDANQGNDPLTNPSFWKVDQWRFQTTTHNITLDSDYTLTSEQNNDGRIVIADTGILLTVARNVIVDNIQKSFIAVNDTLQDLTFKTNAGTGVVIPANTFQNLYNDGTNVIDNEHTGIGTGQTWQDVQGSRSFGVTYTNTTGKPIQVIVSGLSSSTSNNMIFRVNGIDTAINATPTTNATTTHFVIIPDGDTYFLSVVNHTISKWFELR